MTRNTIFLLFGAPFGLAMVFTAMATYQTREILRLISKVDPDRARQLSTVEIPFLRKVIWIDPIAFRRFVESDDWKGNRRLEAKVEAYARTKARIRLVSNVGMLGVLVTALLVFLDVI